MNSGLDIHRNRKEKKYPASVQLRRAAWGLAGVFFRCSPRPCYAWRRFVLRCFGAKIGKKVNVANSATIYFPWNLEIKDWAAIGEHAFVYNLGTIFIGERATVSQRAHLCAGTHDYTDPGLPLETPPIMIGAQAWICADAFVGPGVTVGEGAVVGARAVAMKNVEPWTVAAGNPARAVKKRVLKGAE